MLQVYNDAFSTLLWLLSAITAATAVVVFLYLGKSADVIDSAAGELGPLRTTVMDP